MLLNRYTTNAKELNGSMTLRQQFSSGNRKKPVIMPGGPSDVRKKPKIAKFR